MLLAVISDIHGNLPALEAVLAELEQEQLDEIVCLGDVALGPQTAETVARVRELGCAVVMGNWDAWVLDGFPRAQGDPWRRFIEQGEWWAQTLSAEDCAFMRTFAPRIELELDGVQVLCFHGSPGSNEEMVLATTPHDELLRMFAGFDHPLMLGGHTHVQLTRVVEGTLVINPGSVGLPFRGLPVGELQLISPWAEYALVRIEERRISVDLRRTSYDVEGMLRPTIDSGVPHAVWWADTWVRADSGPPVRGPRRHGHASKLA
jgi:putative phosphoesterase